MKEAVRADKEEHVSYLWDKGTPRDRTKWLKSLLPVAAKEGHLRIVKFFCNRIAVLELQDLNVLHEGNTAFHWAIKNNHSEVVKYLIEVDKTLVQTRTGQVNLTALHLASLEGHLNIVKILLENGADLHDQDASRKTALHWSCENGHLEVVKHIIHIGVNTEETICQEVVTSQFGHGLINAKTRMAMFS